MNWSVPQVVVRAAEPGCNAKASLLAQRTGLLLADPGEAHHACEKNDPNQWTLLVSASELSLMRPDGLSVAVDFIRGKGNQRAKETNFSSQPLARALGIKPFLKRNNRRPDIIDATAGFGTDGWMMASLGCTVRLLEASRVLAAMLDDALNNARCAATTADSKNTPQDRDLNNPAHKITVINTNSVQYLNDENNASADIIYLDPMYPPSRNKALVKKGMQLLHDLIGPDSNGDELLDAALHHAKSRVVVKRPRGAPPLQGTREFSGQISVVQSSNTRFDIYHTASGSYE